MRHPWTILAIMMLATLTFGCSEKDDDPPPPTPVLPVISNINASSDPKSPVDAAIEINGTGFLSAPGTVRFLDGTTPTDVVPDVAGWTDTSIVVMVPSSFTPPLTVAVCVITDNGTSATLDLDIVTATTFNPNDLLWSTSTALPEGLRGLRAEACASSATEAYLYVTGGQVSGTPANRADCRVLGLHVSGTAFTVDSAWTAASSLPQARAFHASALAHSGNSSVGSASAFLYVAGGQATATDAPGGTNTVWMASVNLTNGSLGTWTATTSLPAARMGSEAMVYRNTFYLLGGFDTSGNPVDTIYIAEVHSDGTLGAFTTSPTPLPVTVGFFGATAFAGRLYLVGGENQASTNPNDNTPGGELDESYYCSLSGGVVGTFQTTATTTLGKVRKKHILWNAFGQLIVAEGVYSGGIGSTEMTVNKIQSDGTLLSWNGLTGATVAGANVFNCAAALSPISPDGGGPRFFLLGGDNFSDTAVATVWVNTAP